MLKTSAAFAALLDSEPVHLRLTMPDGTQVGNGDRYIMGTENKDVIGFGDAALLVELPPKPVIRSAEWSGGSNAGDDITLGSTVAQQLQVELDREALGGLDLADQTLVAELTADSTGEVLRLMEVKVTQVDSTDDTVTIIACDAMAWAFSEEYALDDTALGFNWEVGVDGETLLRAICGACGVPLGTTGLPAVTLSLVDASGYTYREVIAFLACLWGRFARIDAQGRLVLQWYTAADRPIGPERYYDGELSKADYEYTVGYLKCYVEPLEETLEAGDPTKTQGITFQCPWMTPERLQAVWASIGGFTYRPVLNLRLLGDPRLEPGDVLQVTDRAGVVYTVPCMTLRHEYDGGLVTEITAMGKSESAGSLDETGPVTREIERSVQKIKTSLIKYQDRIEAKVEHLDGHMSSLTQTVDSITQQVQGIDGRMSSITQTVDSITQQVQGIDGHMSSLTQTVDSITQQVQGIDGRMSSITQTVDSITQQVEGLDGKYSSLEQTVDGIGTKVSSLSGDVSKIQQSVDNISISVSGSLGGTASIKLSNGSSGSIDMSNVRSAFAGDKSSITIGAGTVTFSSNTLIVNSRNLQIDQYGNLTAEGGVITGGSLECVAENGYAAKLYGGRLHFFSGDENIGVIIPNTLGDGYGLMCFAQENCHFLGWSSYEVSGGSAYYTPKWLFVRTPFVLNGYTYPAGSLVSRADVCCQYNINLGIDPSNPGGSIFGNDTYGLYMFAHKGGIVIGLKDTTDNYVHMYGRLNMHNYSIVNNSDERLKANIKAPDVSALDVINSVQLYQYDWIQSGKHENLGFVAQQLEAEADPSMVHVDKDTDVHGIANMDFIPYLVKAVQELYSMIKGTPSARIMAETDRWQPSVSYEDKLAFLADLAAKEAELSKVPDREPIITQEVI